MSCAWVFPGQGAQSVGMGSDFYDSPLCQEANDICQFDLLSTMRDGPKEALQQTKICQPALFLHSALVLEKLKEKNPEASADYYLGLSLGEYTALYAAGVLSFSDAMKALAFRGQAMQEACESNPGGMVSVLGLADELVIEACDEVRGDDVLQAANFNANGQVVISGSKTALERAIDVLKEKGAKRALPLQVAGAFHSPLMQTAADQLKSCLEQCTFNPGADKVIGNESARPHSDAEIIDALVKQVTAPVLWSQSVTWLNSDCGVDAYIELGTGRVLSGLIKRTVEGVSLKNAGSLSELEEL